MRASPTGAELLDWAEQRYPQWFPGPVPDRAAAPYELYRYYPSTRNHLGVAAGSVYLLGPLSAGRLTKVGTLADYSSRALANQVASSDEQAARFLMHATFAPTETAIAAVRSMGYAAWLERAFSQPVSRLGRVEVARPAVLRALRVQRTADRGASARARRASA